MPPVNNVSGPSIQSALRNHAQAAKTDTRPRYEQAQAARRNGQSRGPDGNAPAGPTKLPPSQRGQRVDFRA